MFLLKAVHFVHFVIVTSWAATNNENLTLRDRIPVYLQELCPGRGVCLNDDINDVIDPADEEFSCCGACSCSVDCEVNGNCCFQNQTKNSIGHSVTSSHNNKECLYSVTKPQNEAFPSLVHQSYNMISSSPDDAVTNARTNTSVTCGDVSVAPWGSMLPVSSKQTGNIYKNRVCADAFNVTDGEEWSVHLSCEPPSGQYDGASFVSGLQDGFLPDYCFVKFVFEGEMAALRSQICHKAEDYENYECAQDFGIPTFTTATREDIVAACKSGLLSPFRNKFINVFCFICTDRYFTGRRCSSEEVFSKSSYMSTSFVSIIDASVCRTISNEDVIKSRNIETVCPVDTVVQNGIACRAISCPSGQILNQDNRCVHPSEKWIMDNIFMQMVLTSEKNINIELISDPLISFQSPWPKRWIIKGISSITTETESQTRSFLVNQYVTFHAPFNPKSFFLYVQKYINKPWLLTSNNQTVKLTAKLARYQTIPSAMTHSSIKFEPIYRDSSLIKIETLITQLYFCEHVTLLPTEYSLIGNPPYRSISNKITNETLLDGEFTVVDKSIGATVEVCLEKSGFARRISLNDSAKIVPHCLLIQCIATVLIYIALRLTVATS